MSPLLPPWTAAMLAPFSDGNGADSYSNGDGVFSSPAVNPRWRRARTMASQASRTTWFALSSSSATIMGRWRHSTHGLESLTAWDDSDNPNIVGLLGSLSRLTSLSSLKLEGCFETSREEPTLYYDLGHLESLTDLDLSDNYFLKVPISIYKLPRLTRLNLDYCCYLKVLPELPSSLRELRARGCDSLVASNVNDVVSKACYGFAESSSQDREDVLQMLIHGKEIPAWFEHQEQDNGVSVSFPLNCPAPESIALSLCFLLQGKAFLSKQPSVICNGKEFINTSLLNVWSSSYNLCIVCVNSYYFSNLLCQHNHFQMLFPSDYNIRVQRSGARWVCKQNIQDFKKGKSEIGKRKRNS
ncbi:TIR NB-ARC LRR protein [Arachis hypogaea]|nr:TIR NB-ARC LRR protein [Arachis hypogaea]